MARRRTEIEDSGDDLPVALLGPGARSARRAWFEARGLHTWREQYDASQAARRAHGIPDPPDPRLLLTDTSWVNGKRPDPRLLLGDADYWKGKGRDSPQC